MSGTAVTDATQRPSERPYFAYASPERAVLNHLLDQHPRRVTFQELTLVVDHRFRESTLERAVDNLAAAGFVHRDGTGLNPMPAVVSFDRERMATDF
jgi:hypothetical protein